jgi:two-component system nitrogen regulation response regulator NtrX
MDKGRVLIVDDEPAVADYLADLIAGWGYETRTARDGIFALADINSAPPAVVISDVSMPHLDGFGLLREISRTHSGIPVILLTGQGSGAMAVRAIQEEGAFYYFDKPLDADASQRLRIVVERAAEFGAARRENEVLRRELRQRGAFGELIGIPRRCKGFTRSSNRSRRHPLRCLSQVNRAQVKNSSRARYTI